MRVHLVGVARSGMEQLAMLLRGAGHDVSGSEDVAIDPPARSRLEAAGVRCLDGWSPEHVTPAIELVVVDKAIREDNPEARRALELERVRATMSATLRDHFLVGKRPLVVIGTRDRTTPSAMSAWILETAGLEPGFFIGGLPKNFPSGARAASTKRKIIGTTAHPPPFVVEGDIGDAAYWHADAELLDYVAKEGGTTGHEVVIFTGAEHEDDDVPLEKETARFAELVRRLPEAGLIACDANDARARTIVTQHARARTAFYAVDGDPTGDVTPTWLGAMVTVDPASGAQPFDLYAGGSFCGRFALKVHGPQSVRSAVGAIAACAEGFGVDIEKARQALTTFEGIVPQLDARRRSPFRG
jgi:UDP-N-acetylmuramate: L-alanyl-gamma-D-glutamyl-meso-diaminopimelate ligase